MGSLPKTSDQIDRTQVRVALQHLELAMSRDRADLGDVEPLLEEPRDRLMSQVVEVQIRHPGTDAKMLVRQSHGIPGHGEHSIESYAGAPQLLQGLNGAA